MNIIKYFLFKSYRNKFNKEYSKELCLKLMNEEKKLEEIYSPYINIDKA